MPIASPLKRASSGTMSGRRDSGRQHFRPASRLGVLDGQGKGARSLERAHVGVHGVGYLLGLWEWLLTLGGP